MPRAGRAHAAHALRDTASAVARAADPGTRSAASARAAAAGRAGSHPVAGYLVTRSGSRGSRRRRCPPSDVAVGGSGAPVELPCGTDRAHDRDARRLEPVGVLAGECRPRSAELVAHAPAFVAPQHGGMVGAVARGSGGTALPRPYSLVRPVLMGR